MRQRSHWLVLGIGLLAASCGEGETSGAGGVGGAAGTGGTGGAGGTAGMGGVAAECAEPTTSAERYCCYWRAVDCGRMAGGGYFDTCLEEGEARSSVCPAEYDTYVDCAVLQAWLCDGSTGYPYFDGCDSESDALTTCLVDSG